MTEHRTACILCSQNCGIKVQVEGGRLKRIVGDDDHPATRGYLCQKAARLDRYQNHADRLRSPLRRRADGSFEEISWETAIDEIATKLVSIRDQHGGRALAYYGGGGQGNHLGGVYGSCLRTAMRTRFLYSALAQEKTGDFWVNGKMFGRQTCHVTEDVENAQCVIFIGTNPWQAHGIPQARNALRAIRRDPDRTMIVVDPRRTETAAMADLHLALKPGTDAYLLSAILGVLVQEQRIDRSFLRNHTEGSEAVLDVLRGIRVDDQAARAGISTDDVRRAARMLADAESACVRVDLGIQQSLNSTLNSYLEKLIFLLTGNFGRRGGNNLHTFLVPLIGHSEDPREGGKEWTTTITGKQEISKMFPPNVLPLEIDSDHPGRLRALFVDSANPVMSGADSQAYRMAFAKLELLVTIDVALTETAALGHYVLPASSQFEKWESTFFNLSFPVNTFHLRRPLFEPLDGTLPEPEIYRRLLVAMGELPERFPVLRTIAKIDRRLPAMRLFPTALAVTLKLRPKLAAMAPLVLYETLGPTLPDGAKSAAALWGAAHFYARKHPDAVRRSGVDGSGAALGEALFRRFLESPSGALLSEHRYEDVWSLVRTPDRRVRLAIPELLEELKAVTSEPAPGRPVDRPLVLIAGERRSYNANTVYRDPDWRKTDREGALSIHPEDAAALGIDGDSRVRCESSRGAVDVAVRLDDRMFRGVVGLPHGYGLEHPDDSGRRRASGPAVNVLTDSLHCDPLTATPYHKYVPVRLTPLGTGS